MQPLKPSVKGERRYPCGFPGCKWVFTRSNHVLRHHQRVHPGYAKQQQQQGFSATAAAAVPVANTGNGLITTAATASSVRSHNNGNLFTTSDLSAVTSAGLLSHGTSQHRAKSNMRNAPSIVSPFTQSEADRFRELMSRSLIKCDVPDCDQTFKSEAALARHKSMIHAVIADDDEEDDDENSGLVVDMGDGHHPQPQSDYEGEEDDDHDLEDEISAQQISHSSLLLPLLPNLNQTKTISPAVLQSLRILQGAGPGHHLMDSSSNSRKKLNVVHPNHSNSIITTATGLLSHQSPQSLLGSASKPFICSIDSCPKSFTRRDHLKRHQVQSHHQHVLQQTVLQHMMKQQQLQQQTLPVNAASEVILEEEEEDDQWTNGQPEDVTESLEAGSLTAGPPPAKRMKKMTIRRSPAGSAHIVLEDEASDLTMTTTTPNTSLTFLQQQHQASQDNLMKLVSMAEKKAKNGTESSAERNGDKQEVGDEGLIVSEEQAADDEPSHSMSASASDLLPPIAMEPEVVLEVDEDTVWQPATTSNNSNGNRTSSAHSSLHPALAMISDVPPSGRNKLIAGPMHSKNKTSAIAAASGMTEIDDQIDGDEEEEYEDENDAVTAGLSFHPDQSIEQQQQLLQQLLLSRALLSGSLPDEENIYAQAFLQLQQQQQQHRVQQQPAIGKDRPYVCDVPRCDKRYTKHSHLVRHKVETHKMQKPEPRNHPQHSITNTVNLSIQKQQPVRRSSQTMTPSLPQAQQQQRSSAASAAGVVHHHPPPPDLNLNDRPYVCDFPGCRWSFKRQYHLDRHFLTHRQHQPNESAGTGNDSSLTNCNNRNSDTGFQQSMDDENSGDEMMYNENYESNDDNNSQDVLMNSSSNSHIVQSSLPSSKRSNGKQQHPYGQSGGTSLLSPSPLNLKTSNNKSEGSEFNFSSAANVPRRGSPSSSGSSPPVLGNHSKSKKSLSSCLSSLSLPSSASTASALINATTGTNPVKINTTTPGNFTCCFPGCGIKCQSQSSFDAHLYLNHIVTNPLFNKKNKKSSANLISETLLLLEQNAILNHCNQQNNNVVKQNHNNISKSQQQQAVSSNKCPPKNHNNSNSSVAAGRNGSSSITTSHSQTESSPNNNHSNTGEQNNDLSMIQAYSLSLANLMNAVNQSHETSSNSPSSPSISSSASHANNSNSKNSISNHYASIPSLPSPESSSSSPSDVEYNLTSGSSVHSSLNYSADRKGNEKALFTCDIEGCDKKFGRNCELTRHKLNHMDIWPFTCESPGCGRKFKRKDVFKNHLRTHVKEFSSANSSSASSTSPSPSSTVMMTSSSIRTNASSPAFTASS